MATNIRRNKSHKPSRSLESLNVPNPSNTSSSRPSLSNFTPCSAKYEPYDIIGYEQISAPEDADLPSIAQDTMRQSLSSAVHDSVDDKLVFGNRPGIDLLQEKSTFHDRFDKMEEELRSLTKKAEIESKKAEFESKRTQARIDQLSAASPGYILIRQRFLDTFRRDVLKYPAAKHTPMIHADNVAADDGDAVTDATLFTTGARSDAGIMYTLYGMSADEVLSLSATQDYDSLAVLNARATLKSNKQNEVPRPVELAWENYVLALRSYWGCFPQKDPQSALGKAYYSFWQAFNG